MEEPITGGYTPEPEKQNERQHADGSSQTTFGKSDDTTFDKSDDTTFGKSGVKAERGSGDATEVIPGGENDDDAIRRVVAPEDGGKALRDKKSRDDADATSSIEVRPRAFLAARDKNDRDDAEAGEILGTRYRFVEKLGKGGQGSVYLVEDTTMGVRVAVKIFPPKVTIDAVDIQQIRNEVRIPRTLRNPLIAAINDLVELANGRLGISMEYIEGCNLWEWMNNEGADRWNRAGDFLTILRKLAQALHVAHEAKVVHRDLKPQNVMLRNGICDRLVLVDFGLALPDERNPDCLVGGTCSYMAPEQYERPGEVDYRADLFAFGVIAYQLFTGMLPPCSLKDIKETRKAPKIPVGSIPSVCNFNPRVPLSLDQTIRQLLSFAPGERPRSAAEIAARLDEIEIIDPMDALARSGTKRSDDAVDRVEVPAGEFYIGSGGTGTAECERPRRRIYVDGFSISVFSVTNAVYRRFVEATGHNMPQWADDEVFGRADHPVVGVTWEEALECCRWLGGTLPTEAQWERAAKGDDGRLYPWGGVFEMDRANVDFYQNSTTPVGAFPNGRSPFGCFDMAGNVREWCMDGYDAQAYKRMSEGCKNPLVKAAGANTERVLRGGGFGSLRSEARCTFRGHLPQDAREQDIGFRVVFIFK